MNTHHYQLCELRGSTSNFIAMLRYRPVDSAAEVPLPARAVGDVRFESAAPYRQVRSYRGQRNYCGDWWLATSKRHVAFESWCERDYLIALDFDPDVLAVTAQPFVLSFEASDGSQREHVPDFFVRTPSGTAVVVDMRLDNLSCPNTATPSPQPASC